MNEKTRTSLLQMADTLNGLPAGKQAKMQYCMLSDALLWSDEVPRMCPDWPTEYSQILRFVFRYRTTILLSDPDKRLEDTYEFGQSQFPNWPGFRPERITPSVEILEFYEKAKRNSKEKLQDIPE